MIKIIIVNFNDIDLKDSIEFVKFMNAEASKWLTMIHFEKCTGNVLDELSNVFINVEFFAFSRSESIEFKFKEDQRMSKIFPKLKKLIIKLTKVADWSFFDGPIPALEALVLTEPNEVQEQIIKFIKRNQQIGDLKIYKTNQLFLKQINENLPNLNILKLNDISGVYDGQPPIHFEKVEVLVMFECKIIPENLFFDSLDILILDFNKNEFVDKWLEYLETKINKDLRLMRLVVERLSKVHFLGIPKLPNLVTAIIQCQSPFSAQEIAEFLDKATHLEVLEIAFQQEQLENNVPVEAANLAKKNNKIWNIRKPAPLETSNDHSSYQFFSE